MFLTIKKLVIKRVALTDVPKRNFVSTKKQAELAKLHRIKKILSLSFLEHTNKVSQVISGHVLQESATLVNIENLNSSDGWILNFKKCYNLREYKQTGEVANTLIEELRRITN